MSDPPAPLAEIERLTRNGDIAGAATLLETTLGGGTGDLESWLQLAGLRRALRQPRRSLEAVHKALEQAPLDFMALVMRAGLLERIGDRGAGEAWAEALAQRPPGELPSALAAAVAQGEHVHAAWLAERAAQLASATAEAEQGAGEDEVWRIARFRDNALRKTQVYRSQPTHYHYPGLREREFHPRARFPWLPELEALTGVIREEMLTVMHAERAELVPYIQYSAHEALAHWRSLNHNRDWTAIHLIEKGKRIAANAGLSPQTMAFLERMAQPVIPGASPNAMFSLLAPQTTIPPHVGVNNTRLLCHLPLVVPPGCWFRVGAETRHWHEGESFVFDDTIEHEAANPSGELRVVLIFDLWHPDLAAVEREAVSALIGAECRSE